MALDFLSLARFSVTLAFLLAASREDLKTRTVDDRYWHILGAVGLCLLAGEMLNDGANAAHYLLLVPIGLLFYDPYIDREPIYEKGKFCWPAVAAFAAAGAASGCALYFGGLTPILIIPSMFLLVYALYFTNIIHGGADAKALMSIALVLPWYPDLPGLPLIATPAGIADVVDISFPFMMLVLMMGSLSVMFLPFYNLAANVKRGDFVWPLAFFGRRVKVAEAEKALVWPMERLVDGKMQRALFPKRGRYLSKEYEALKSAGIQDVWVTHKIPFIIPITAGLVLAAVVGNVVYWLGRIIS
ncbi:MAG: A24 family peptidase C-terminal domain-containing protein [Methanobacteriota archaeon]